MYCWKCSTPLEETDKLSFRATCDTCSAWLHCCRNCQYYRPGLSNDCAIPDTERITDREAANFCEDFSLLGLAQEKRVDPKDVARRLFGDNE